MDKERPCNPWRFRQSLSIREFCCLLAEIDPSEHSVFNESTYPPIEIDIKMRRTEEWKKVFEEQIKIEDKFDDDEVPF